MVTIIMARLSNITAFLILILGSVIRNRTFAGVKYSIISNSLNNRDLNTKWGQQSIVCSHLIKLIDSSESMIRNCAARFQKDRSYPKVKKGHTAALHVPDIVPLTFHLRILTAPDLQVKEIAV